MDQKVEMWSINQLVQIEMDFQKEFSMTCKDRKKSFPTCPFCESAFNLSREEKRKISRFRSRKPEFLRLVEKQEKNFRCERVCEGTLFQALADDDNDNDDNNVDDGNSVDDDDIDDDDNVIDDDDYDDGLLSGLTDASCRKFAWSDWIEKENGWKVWEPRIAYMHSKRRWRVQIHLQCPGYMA